MKFLSTSKLLPPAFKFLLLSLFINLLSFSTYAQNWFSMPSFWEVGGPGMAFNIEAFDMNKDGKLDVVVGNWNNTYVYYGGHGILNQVVDVVYTGRMLAICDYNGDGFDDMIAMHLTDFDSTREDYNGELLFYWGSDSTELAIDTIPDYSIPLPTLYPKFERFTEGYISVGVKKGDLNGDGKIDVVLNSTHFVDSSGSISGYGVIYVYMGKEIPTDTADFKIVGHNPSSYYGHFFDVGNINGDAFDDLLISSNLFRRVGSSPDSINYLHIFYGSEDFALSHGNESILYSSNVNYSDRTADWFIRRFSVDDINGDGIDDLVVGRTLFNYPQKTTVHYGGASGIDTIPSFTFIQDTTNFDFFSAGGVTINIGDFNDDGYDDFIITPASYQQFALHFGGPHVSNSNKYGARGYSKGGGVFPRKSVNMGNQSHDNVKDIAVITGNSGANTQTGNGYVLMLYGQRIATDIEEEIYPINNFGLLQNYPNPFNGSTVISYRHSAFGNVKLMIYDTLGREVTALVNEEKPAGEYKIEFDALKYNLASGVYFCELNLEGGERARIKIVFLK